MRGEVAASVAQQERFGGAVLRMQHEMRARDDALRKVPSNCAALLKELKRQAEATTARCEDVERRFAGKLDAAIFESEMKGKLPSAVFYRVFPTSRTPADHLRAMIKAEAAAGHQEIRNMVKLWD